MKVEAEPTLSESIEDTENIASWNRLRESSELQTFIDAKLANTALEQIVL